MVIYCWEGGQNSEICDQSIREELVLRRGSEKAADKAELKGEQEMSADSEEHRPDAGAGSPTFACWICNAKTDPAEDSAESLLIALP